MKVIGKLVMIRFDGEITQKEPNSAFGRTGQTNVKYETPTKNKLNFKTTCKLRAHTS